MVYLYSLLTCFNGSYSSFNRIIDWNELFIFTTVSFIMTTILLLYYNKISHKTKYNSSQIETPIYNTKDAFLQENIISSNVATAEKEISTVTKIIIFILVILIASTSIMSLITRGSIEYLH